MSEIPNKIIFNSIKDLRHYAYTEKQQILDAAPQPSKYRYEDFAGDNYEVINNQPEKDPDYSRAEKKPDVKAESRVYKYQQDNYDVTVWANIYSNDCFDSNILMKGMVGDIEVNVSYSYSSSYSKLRLNQISFTKGQATVWTFATGADGFYFNYKGRQPNKDGADMQNAQILLKVLNEFAQLDNVIELEGVQEKDSNDATSTDGAETGILREHIKDAVLPVLKEAIDE